MIKMIRFIFIALLTLTLSCANTSPEPADDGLEMLTGTGASSTVAETAAPTNATGSGSTSTPPQEKNYVRLPKAERQSIDSVIQAENVQKQKSREAARLAVAHATEKSAAEQTVTELAAIEPVAGNAGQTLASAEGVAVAGNAGQTTAMAEGVAATGIGIADPGVADPAAIDAYAGQDGSLAGSGIAENSAVMPLSAVSTNEIQSEKQPFLPTTKKRIDREINKIKYVYKGEVMLGMTASFGTVDSNDSDILLILDNITADATMATIKPFVGYFYRDNNCVGMRFGYTHMGGRLDDALLDLGESNDANFDIPKISLNSNNYSLGIFHRSYAGLDPKGRFGLFAEFELSASMGHTKFAQYKDDKWVHTNSDNLQFKLMFNPGFSVFIFPNVCAGVSFGLGGIQYTKVTQEDENGKWKGSRESSKMNFRLNLAAINFGMTIHLWDKKKQ